MNIFIKFVFLFCFMLGCFSCNDVPKKTRESKKETCMYGFNEAETKVSWSAYKTTDKVKVTGYFKTLSTDRTGILYTSIMEFVDGINFSINSSSSISGDVIRDASVKDYFFKFFTENFQINGNLEVVSQKKVIAHLDMFGVDTPIALSFSIAEDMLNLRGRISLNEIGAVQAFNSIHDKCVDLHRGPDGISKTWDQVDISIDIPIVKDCR